MTIERIDDISVKITTPSEEVVSVSDLQAKVDDAQKALDAFEAWVAAERAARQAILDGNKATLDQANTIVSVKLTPPTPAQII